MRARIEDAPAGRGIRVEPNFCGAKRFASVNTLPLSAIVPSCVPGMKGGRAVAGVLRFWSIKAEIVVGILLTVADEAIFVWLGSAGTDSGAS